MRSITERQAEILVFIEKFIQENDYSPSVREIAAHFGVSVKCAFDHVSALIKKDFIRQRAGKSRTMRRTAKKRGVEA